MWLGGLSLPHGLSQSGSPSWNMHDCMRNEGAYSVTAREDTTSFSVSKQSKPCMLHLEVPRGAPESAAIRLVRSRVDRGITPEEAFHLERHDARLRQNELTFPLTMRLVTAAV